MKQKKLIEKMKECGAIFVPDDNITFDEIVVSINDTADFDTDYISTQVFRIKTMEEFIFLLDLCESNDKVLGILFDSRKQHNKE